MYPIKYIAKLFNNIQCLYLTFTFSQILFTLKFKIFSQIYHKLLINLPSNYATIYFFSQSKVFIPTPAMYNTIKDLSGHKFVHLNWAQDFPEADFAISPTKVIHATFIVTRF